MLEVFFVQDNLKWKSKHVIFFLYLFCGKNTDLKRYLHPNVQRSIIYNFQDMEAT